MTGAYYKRDVSVDEFVECGELNRRDSEWRREEAYFLLGEFMLAEVFGEKFEARRVTALDGDAVQAGLNGEIVWRSEEKLAWNLDVLHFRNVVEFVAVKGGEQLVLELTNQAGQVHCIGFRDKQDET